MESAATPVPFAVGLADVPELDRIFDRPGPFVSVQLTTEPKLENAAQRSMQHWRTVRDDLESQGADGATLDAIEEIVPDLHQNGAGSFILAAGGEVLLSFGMTDQPDRDRGTVSTLPTVAPMVAWRQSHLPHVIVLTDRVGADILAVGPSGRHGTETAGSNDPGNPLHRKTHPGGWSQQRYQERAENSWEANAKKVAERVGEVSELIDPAAILVAGDVRATTLLKEELDERLTPLLCEFDGTRAADGGGDAMSDEVRRQLNTVAASHTVAILEKFREEKGQDDRATDGLAATIEALNAAQVETLLVHDDPDDDRQAWFAPDGALVAADRATLEGYGVSDPQQGRLVDALIRTAFRSGASVRIVPRTVVADGVGAILRFSI